MKKILIVEDEQIFAQDLKMIMESEGYSVESIVDSGTEAIKKIEQNKPDIILMDIKIHGKIDGIDLTKEIQKKNNIPIIYLTAYTEKSTVDRAMETNPVAYMVKPIFDNDLIDVVKKALK
ncbi:MAG: response regulator [Candidatus Cloacimonadota bacterium]|nr:MAG: response regulator [Candidatus Cloacimonadota bacterium]RLC54274.1 MAG: response regulator [Candidatus Cloacimonadota bacterium]